jgi:uncharacterized protein with HEPN domain
MTDARLLDLIAHIKHAALDAQSFIEGTSRERFETDKKSQQAVIFSLLIVGEAATKIMERYPEFTEENSHIPWRSMRGMRNRFAHGYFDINLDVVWDTVQNAVPELLKQLDSIN